MKITGTVLSSAVLRAEIFWVSNAGLRSHKPDIVTVTSTIVSSKHATHLKEILTNLGKNSAKGS